MCYKIHHQLIAIEPANYYTAGDSRTRGNHKLRLGSVSSQISPEEAKGLRGFPYCLVDVFRPGQIFVAGCVTNLLIKQSSMGIPPAKTMETNPCNVLQDPPSADCH
jgi:hypothetical protein